MSKADAWNKRPLFVCAAGRRRGEAVRKLAETTVRFPQSRKDACASRSRDRACIGGRERLFRRSKTKLAHMRIWAAPAKRDSGVCDRMKKVRSRMRTFQYVLHGGRQTAAQQVTGRIVADAFIQVLGLRRCPRVRKAQRTRYRARALNCRPPVAVPRPRPACERPVR